MNHLYSVCFENQGLFKVRADLDRAGSCFLCVSVCLLMESLSGCVCFSHSDDLLSVLLAGAGPPSFDGLLFKQRHQFVGRLVQKLQVTFFWRLGRTQHVVQVHYQVT